MAVLKSNRLRRCILSCLVGALFAGESSAELPYSKPEKIVVAILAVSTMTRHGWAGDEDIYLATLIDKDGQRRLIRLADWKGRGGPAVAAMSAGAVYRLVATRTHWCDVTAAQFYLPPSTGDRAQYFSVSSAADEPIPCYRDEHGSIRVMKPSAKAQQPITDR
jgi:hypothetical protein